MSWPHVANVALAVALEDRQRGRLLERTFGARVDIGDGEPASMAKAMGQALDDAVAQVADAVRLSLQAIPPRRTNVESIGRVDYGGGLG